MASPEASLSNSNSEDYSGSESANSDDIYSEESGESSDPVVPVMEKMGREMKME